MRPSRSIDEQRDFELRCWTADQMEKLEAEITKLEQEAIQARTALLERYNQMIANRTMARVYAKLFKPCISIGVRFEELSPEIRRAIKKQLGIKSNAKKAKTHREAKETPKGASRRKHSSRSGRKGRI